MPASPSPLLPQLSALSLPKPGARLDLPSLAGSADGLAIAQLAGAGRPQVVVTASPLDAQRLQEEIAWFAPGLRVHLLPDWETLPYDGFSPHQDLISERLATLYAVTRGECDVLLVAASTALTRLAPPSFLAAHTFFIKKGDALHLDKLKEQLTVAGYQHVTQVVAAGEYSVRGGLVDLFPMGTVLPFRIELFDEEVETLRTFDVDSQRTLYPVPEIRLLPAREFPLGEAGRNKFRARFRETFEGDASRIALYKDVSSGTLPAGIEYYLPLFFDQTATLFDYLPTDSILLLHRDVPAAIAEFWVDTRSRHKMLGGDRSRPVLGPEELFLSDEQFFTATHAYPTLRLGARAEVTDVLAAALPAVEVNRKADQPLAALKGFLQGFAGRVLLLAESAGRRETMAEYLAEHSLTPTPCADFASFIASGEAFMLGTGPASGGFVLAGAGIALITENELYAATARPRHKRDMARRANLEGWLRDLSELKIGDPVVHENHGIGRYLGLAHMDYGDGDTEFLHLEYAEGATLYVPVSQLQVISRYSGADPEAVELHRLGSGQWEKAKRKAAEQVRDTAAELLHLYAQRAARQGHRFEFKTHDLEAFADGFGFEETPDQQAAIEAVVADMGSGKPMDRLVCGDVGFGKTEVAMRAAFVAVAGGKQVAVLCPTTLLAEQHYQNFADRFADWPVKVAELSRFRSAKEQAEAIQGLGEGKIDILIGTHRLLQKDVSFSRLGLVIIDEEHRFGVRQKEALKTLRAEVDVLTLTATPIPRTLGLSLEGLRDFSVIATAPQKRLAIKTFVAKWATSQVREACLREFKRGGQVYFLHNEVETIENMRERLAALLPEARIVVGHGQLPERELERVMREFTQQKHNLLLCSTIIETGIDNPHANTIIINRADRFGVAQLHQLRGRVGRSHHQAYAYLLTDEHAKPTAQAQRRLEAIQAMEELGSGFFLAMHDLEIRGAGEVLGENQSGEIQEIGFAMYTNMLNAAVKALKEGKAIPDLTQPLAITSEINLRTPALLPNDYCPDVHERLTLYKRLANCEDEETLRDLREELVDRFGELPPQGLALLETHRLRVLGRPLGVSKLDAGPQSIQVQFVPNPPIDPMAVIQLIQSDRNFKLAGPDRLVWNRPTPTLQERASSIRELFGKLAAA
ncbi:transcription-repair coupling factor [Denitratisoma oestradiolicum]|uniref:Transcription-repair-coupling factor n=1 Tax=Denitratisoma oestradiolicum TaxID=311182 RepID=A0A6S6XVJ2_9PROT|nr:transcription-repair coupling factor [Denitratisoma oestradiolicum]TWO79595.1 transcription-repair coupling factor [Denitratisoma oestradiolicum]CAB1368077.1 Transcription-repair-coupling factor [Denitratisoma oestradiolicum]